MVTEATASKDLLGTLGINAKLFAAQLVNFTIVLLVMWRWVYRPLVKMMDARAKEISDGLARGKEAEMLRVDAAAEREEIIREAHARARELSEAAEADAEALRVKKLALAKAEIEKLVDDAKVRIQRERTQTFDELKRETASLVALATQKLAVSLDEKKQRALIAEAIKELGSSS